MVSLKWLCCTICLLGLVTPSLDCTSSPQSRVRLGDLECYLVQMHIHGHSNHNGNELPASMESHCSEAVNNDFDVVWWTDHARLFETYEDIRIDFRTASIDPNSGSIDLAEGRARELTRLDVSRPRRGSRIEIENGSLLVEVESEPGSGDFTRVVLALASARGKVHTLEYCRPVTSGLRFRTWGDVEGLGGDTYLRIGFDFSLHPRGQHHARFDIVERLTEGPVVLGDTTVLWEIGYLYPQGMVSIDLEKAVAPLPNGDDNTLSATWIEIGARNGESISVMLDSLSITSMKPTGENQYEVVDRLVRRYTDQYGVTQYTGVEIGLVHTPRLPHMNAYFPDSTQTYESVSLARDMRRDSWVEEVHRRGGLVSLNHPFGASLTPRKATGTDYPSGLSIRELSEAAPSVTETDFWDVAKPILDDDGLGADILEVGYLFRGIGSLEDHLRLWDLALANGINLVGNGASDSHGGKWQPDMVPNPFASWVWARKRTADGILKALKAGRVAFGDPFLWQGKFAFGVEDAIMGDTLRVAGGEARAWIYMEPWRDDIDIRLIQIKIKKGRELAVLRDESIEYDRYGVDIRVDDPCYIRAEIYRKDGTPLVFSNPVFLIPQ